MVTGPKKLDEPAPEPAPEHRQDLVPEAVRLRNQLAIYYAKAETVPNGELAITQAGHGAVDTIDILLAELHKIRQAVTGRNAQRHDELMARTDRLLNDVAVCGCPWVKGSIRHLRNVCTDAVVKEHGWYAP